MRTIREFMNLLTESSTTPNVWYNPYREMYISFEATADERVFKEFIVDVAEGIQIDNSVKPAKTVPAGTLAKFADTPEGIFSSHDNDDLIEEVITNVENALMPFYFEKGAVESDEDEEYDLSHVLGVRLANGVHYWFEGATDFEVFEEVLNRLSIKNRTISGYDGKAKLVPNDLLGEWVENEPADFEAAYAEMDELLRPYALQP